MALSLDQLKAAFKQPENSGNTLPNNYYTFWNMKDGESATIRFLPDANQDNPLGFLVERLAHQLEINGERKTIPCLKMYDEDCPICNVSAAYYKDNDKDNGKKYWRKKSHIAQVLVKEDPLPADDNGESAEGKVKFISLSYQIYNAIKDAFESGELDEVPFAYDEGCDFIIKKTKQGDYPSYALSKFSRKTSDLSADEVEFVEEQLSDLSNLLPANPTREKVEAMLEAALTGEAYSDDAPSAPAPTAAKEEAPAKAEPAKAAKEEVVVEESTSESEAPADNGDKILQQIRERREAKAS